MGADPFTTSQRLKTCIITQFLLYHKICRISISERVLRKILSRCNRWIYEALQALILLYIKLSYHAFHRDYSAYKKLFFTPKMHNKKYTASAPGKVFNSQGNHHNRIISCTEISAHHLPRYRTSRRENYGRY